MIDSKELLNANFTTISNLLLNYYRKVGMTNQELVFYMQLLKFNQKSNLFPDLSRVSKAMAIPVDELFPILQSIIDKGFISIETTTNQKGQKEDCYDLTLIYERLHLYLEQEEKRKQETNEEKKTAELYQTFETEFGRPLSPIEFETIQNWLTTDQYDISLIQLALREAVLNQAYSLKYIDRILLSWERKNLKSKEQVEANQKQRLSKKVSQEKVTEEELPHIPMYNWLNPE